jgi:tetratricopeptide (TPR) repeat protein
MSRKITLSIIAVIAFIALGSYRIAKGDSLQPLSKTELMALVAGDSQPENITHEIRVNGLNFTPDDDYKVLLKAAGANSKVMAALPDAKVFASAKPNTGDAMLLKHLSHAGSLYKSGQLEKAAAELSSAFSGNKGKSEIGFVMGIILAYEQRWQEAGEIYYEILERDPNFPQVHTRLSFVNYNIGNSDEALRQARAAIECNPEDPSAHLNAGLSLRNLGHMDAAKDEIQKAIHFKPDFVDGLIGLATIYSDKGDYVSAIVKLREAKRLAPNRLDVRQNLGAALRQSDPAAAIAEFQELEKIAPDYPMCHQCLGGVLYETGRYQEAQKEFQIAAEADPSAARPHTGLGRIYEADKNYDEALREFRLAEKLDSGFSPAYMDAGRVLLLKKEFAAAIAELKRAEDLEPTDWISADLRGQAFEGSGDRDAAIPEYKRAVSLAPKEPQARLDLAFALEKKGDWIGALDNYRQAVIDEAPPKIGVPQLYFDPTGKFQSAQQRFQQHLADLRSAGKSAEASILETQWQAKLSTPNLDESYRLAMQSASKALMEKRFNDAETSAKQAVAIAEKIQPTDARLPESVGALGSVYGWRLDFKQAGDAFQRQLVLTQKLYGADSPMIANALVNLANVAAAQKDFATAEPLYNRVLDLNMKTYGENSSATADTLRGLGQMYAMQGDAAKSEATLLHVLKIFENMYGADDFQVSLPLSLLCYGYDQSGATAKSQTCHARLLGIAEKQFGPDSPYLAGELNAEAAALRKLGRADEAAKFENRLKSLQAAQTSPN